MNTPATLIPPSPGPAGAVIACRPGALPFCGATNRHGQSGMTAGCATQAEGCHV